MFSGKWISLNITIITDSDNNPWFKGAIVLEYKTFRQAIYANVKSNQAKLFSNFEGVSDLETPLNMQPNTVFCTL